jgi:hypothetical protein
MLLLNVYRPSSTKGLQLNLNILMPSYIPTNCKKYSKPHVLCYTMEFEKNNFNPFWAIMYILDGG